MSASTAPFVFMTCRAGAEAVLKAEVARTDPAWRPAFTRPGFVTFKLTNETNLDDRTLAARHWTFAHAHGVSLGRFKGESLERLVEQVWQHKELAAIACCEPFADVHVWQRESHVPDERGYESVYTPLAEEVERALRSGAPTAAQALREAGEPSPSSVPCPRRRRASPRNSLVLDTVLVEPGEWWVGYHRALLAQQRWPGGAIPVRLPPHAVSRAYLKMEEALQWSGLPLAPDDEVVEIGCAPGGASQALLDRGLFVTGIDPADVDPALVEHPRFRHLKKRGKDVRRKEFIDVRWLAADMNIAPSGTLDTVEAIVSHSGIAIRGMILTLKFAQWSDASQLPELVERVRTWGYRDIRVRQLVTGGTEVCVAALKRRALRRLGRSHGRRRSQSSKRVDGAHAAPPKPHFS